MQQYPKEYIQFLVYFHTDRDFFECHEVLEEFWKKGELQAYNFAWVGLIQVAVAMYHHRRGNTTGAAKMLKSAILQLSNKSKLEQLGMDETKFLQVLKERLEDLTHKKQDPYIDINIPIKDPALLQLCINEAEKKQLSWEQPSDMLKESLLHKHSLRDRSEVIQARLEQKRLKQQLRQKGLR